MSKEREMVEIIPTCVPQSADDISKTSELIQTFTKQIHIDIADGIFAPSHTWPYTEHGTFEKFDLSAALDLQKEVHLMVEEPRQIGIEAARAGAFRIIGHAEAFSSESEAHGALDAWRRAGAKEVGLGLLLDTPFELIEHHVHILNVVHLMSIATIGKQGISYDERAPERIAQFHERFPDILISVDGGVAESNIQDLVRAGARRFGVGSAISKAADPKGVYERLKRLAQMSAL